MLIHIIYISDPFLILPGTAGPLLEHVVETIADGVRVLELNDPW